MIDQEFLDEIYDDAVCIGDMENIQTSIADIVHDEFLRRMWYFETTTEESKCFLSEVIERYLLNEEPTMYKPELTLYHSLNDLLSEYIIVYDKDVDVYLLAEKEELTFDPDCVLDSETVRLTNDDIKAIKTKYKELRKKD